ncbi:cysteine-rich receptor-like protein kinase 44 [Populus nigra]|uniref:cysteine-rich receptor-like protein kinase 44 n=1 Tax=Populus nigra TaxID=3691 RepID=UPI002B274E78|nr:cysteine-rich receptor-like protein kinase 44 [Populus nigra]
MAFLQMLFLLCPIFMHFIVPITAQPDINFQLCVAENGNYTENSTYQANLKYLLNSVYSNTEIDYGFYNFSYGESSNKVYAIGLCRGDVKPDACRDCLNYSSRVLTARCPTEKEAIIGLDNCILRYASRYIFGLNEVAPYFFVHSLTNVSDEKGFNRSLNSLLDSLQDEAAAGDSRRKYATGKISAPNFQTIYALSQCTPDLSQTECSSCLRNASARVGQCCQESQGGRVIYPSCNFRYEINQFYEIPTGEDPSPPPSKGKNNTVIVIIILSVVISVMVILIISFYTFSGKRKSREKVKSGSVDDEITRVESLQYNLEIIHLATYNFSEVNKLGQGGFGSVYKGTLPNGQYIAVKRLSRDSTQGEQEFKNEVLLVAKLQHKNLVRLLGFCFEQEERLLIYEFMPNSSLNNFIFDQTKRSQLDWERRYKIIEGISRGLLYLHEDSRLRIIHRDLKPSNILLDAEMNAKISDFGMARLFAGDQTQESTSRVVGTFGYMPPEYVMRGHFSVKSDIFSFGVLVLEIVSGRKRTFINEGEMEDLLTYTWENWNSGPNLDKLIDATLRAGSRNEMLRCIHVGLLCVQENALDRPNMASVVIMLSSYSVTLPVPQKPAFFARGTVLPGTSSTWTESDQSRSASVPFSINEASISELYPR